MLSVKQSFAAQDLVLPHNSITTTREPDKCCKTRHDGSTPVHDCKENASKTNPASLLSGSRVVTVYDVRFCNSHRAEIAKSSLG